MVPAAVIGRTTSNSSVPAGRICPRAHCSARSGGSAITPTVETQSSSNQSEEMSWCGAVDDMNRIAMLEESIRA